MTRDSLKIIILTLITSRTTIVTFSVTIHIVIVVI